MWFALKLAFAGLGHMVAHWSIGIMVIAACLVLEFAGGWVVSYAPFLAKPIQWVQKYLMFIAIGTALVLFGEWLGARDLAARCEAKAAVVSGEVHKQVENAKTSTRKDKWAVDK